jgi:hypothetical protein
VIITGGAVGGIVIGGSTAGPASIASRPLVPAVSASAACALELDVFFAMSCA